MLERAINDLDNTIRRMVTQTKSRFLYKKIDTVNTANKQYLQFYFESISEAAFADLDNKAAFKIDTIKVTKSNQYTNMSGITLTFSNGTKFDMGNPRFFDNNRTHTLDVTYYDVRQILL